MNLRINAVLQLIHRIELEDICLLPGVLVWVETYSLDTAFLRAELEGLTLRFKAQSPETVAVKIPIDSFMFRQ